MSTDGPNELLHAAVDGPVTPLDHGRLRRRARRRTVGQRLSASAVVVMIVAVGVMLTPLDEPATPEIPAGAVELPLPPTGQVVADGIGEVPVFVVHTEAGDVHVLDARSPHDPFPEVLAWCETSQTFEDLWHGAMYSLDGGYWVAGGPGTQGMGSYEVLDAADGHVIVGDQQPPPGMTGRPDDIPEPGPKCDSRTALYQPGHTPDPTVVDDLVVHDPAAFPDELWLPTPERVLGQAARSPLDQTAPAASDTPTDAEPTPPLEHRRVWPFIALGAVIVTIAGLVAARRGTD